MEQLEISTDEQKLNIPYITSFLSQTYWAKNRSVEEMETCIRFSINFGVYLNKNQIGYARVVSDRVQFAYIMDVFIDEKQRGKGYSKLLVQAILENPELKSVKVVRLATSDAHELYKKFGFQILSNPENMMEKKYK